MENSSIKIGFIEDNELLLANYKEYFESDERFHCLFAIGSISELNQELHTESPDIILLDIQLPSVNGIDAIPMLSKQFVGATIIMMTAYEDQENILNSFNNGAQGFLTKNMSLSAVRDAVLSTYSNGAALSPSAAKTLIGSLAQRRSKMNAIVSNLTPREKEIARYIKSGLSYKEIAQELYISARTVNQHLKHIYQKTGVSSRSQLAAKMGE